MLVKQLKKLLEGVDENLEIILQSDPEGNAYHNCSGIDDKCCASNELDIYTIDTDEKDLKDMALKKVLIIHP